MSSAIDLKCDVSESSINKKHHGLYTRFRNLQKELTRKACTEEGHNNASFPWSADEVGQENPDNRSFQDLYNELELVINEMKDSGALGDDPHPLRPPSEPEMRSLANDGAIVVFVPTSLRSDTLVVTSSSVQHIELPDLAYDVVTAKMKEMKEILERTTNVLKNRSSDNKWLRKFLRWLWNKAVKPVYDRLYEALKLGSREETTRIWWIGVGPLSRAPFHAAGYHSLKQIVPGWDRIRSSYIQTIKALSFARQRASRGDGEAQVRIDLISMPDTPGLGSLPRVDKEMKCIKDIAEKSSMVRETIINKSKAQVTDHLKLNFNGVMRIVHFACHGLPDPKNPLKSHMVLQGDNNSEIATLSVWEVFDMQVKDAYLAFLSACHSANNSVEDLNDEGLHIVSSFLLAGFRNVIGNLWKAEDRSSQLFTENFYGYLLAADCEDKKGVEVSEAYHHALQMVRKDCPEDIIGWIPFVHFGA